MAINLSTLGLTLFLLTILLCITLPILIGIYVYKDSRRRGMNVVLWTLLSAFAPGFVGLIIYLIVRSDSSGTRCSSCNGLVRESFAVCPHCGTSLKEHCRTCNSVLESGWVNCPQCGTEIPEDQKEHLNITPKKDKGLKWLLAVLIIVPVLLFIILVGSTHIRIKQQIGFQYTFNTYDTKEKAISDFPFLRDWMAECDKKGEGVYQYRLEDDDSSDENTQRYIIYNNDGRGIEDIETAKGGIFKTENELHLQYGYYSHDPNTPVWDHTGPDRVLVYYDDAVKYFEIYTDDFDGFRVFDWKGDEVEIHK